MEHGDGRLVTYIDQITDAFLEEVAERQPDVLILCGDLTTNGELPATRAWRRNCAGWRSRESPWW